MVSTDVSNIPDSVGNVYDVGRGPSLERSELAMHPDTQVLVMIARIIVFMPPSAQTNCKFGLSEGKCLPDPNSMIIRPYAREWIEGKLHLWNLADSEKHHVKTWQSSVYRNGYRYIVAVD